MTIVEVPGIGDVEFPDDMTDDQISDAIKKNLAPQEPAPEPTFGDKALDVAKNFGSAAIRPIVKGVTGIPGVFADGTMTAWNLLSGQNNEMPSHATNRVLDQYTRKPEGVIGKGSEFVSSALVGSFMPAPQIKNPAPTNFVKPSANPVRDATLAAGRQEGLVVPPSTTNPSLLNRSLESIGGKVGTAQDASIKNQSIFNDLAKRSIGMTDDITPDALKAVRAQASQANQAIRQTGDIATDPKFDSAIADVLSKYKSAGGVSKKLAQTEIEDIANSFEKTFPASDAVDAVQVLRDRATAAYAKGDAEVGKGYRALSKALEDQIERHLATKGSNGADLLKSFREGRQLMAKTYSLEKALNPSTGNVQAAKLAAQLAKGKPLSGELKTIAQFAQAFPKASREIVDSGSVRNTDVILGAGAALLKKEPTLLLYPFLRQGVRAGLLSEAGQRLTVPSAYQIAPGTLMGGLTAEEQARYGLFGQ